MLTTTRREIVNDYDISQNKQLRSFMPTNQEQTSQRRFEDTSSSAKAEYKPSANYMSRSEIAQKLYGQNYSEDLVESADKIEQDFSDPDLMPSMQTMQITRNGFARPVERTKSYANTNTKAKSGSVSAISTRSKILIASYAAVVLALILIITLTTVSIASLFADVGAMEAKLESQKQTIAMLDKNIETADSAETIFNKASKVGMTSPTSSTKFELPQTKVAQNIAVSSNWFDSFCNWISSIFGG